jgi:hypothetical protein
VSEEREEWWDADGISHRAEAVSGGNYSCEECEGDVPATMECRWSDGEESCGLTWLCDAHYEAMRAEPHHNPRGGFADEYVNLGAAL